MKKFLAISAIASTILMAGGDIAPVAVEEPMVVAPVVTDAGFYLGLAYGFLGEDYTRTNPNPTALSFSENFSTIMLQAGYKFNSYVAVEGRYWAGIDDVTLAAYTNAIDAPDAFGIYVKPMYPVTNAFDVYALLGYAATDTNINKVDGFSWGLGASYAFTDSVSAFVDYVSLYDDNRNLPAPSTINKAYDIDTVNVGVTYNF